MTLRCLLISSFCLYIIGIKAQEAEFSCERMWLKKRIILRR